MRSSTACDNGIKAAPHIPCSKRKSTIWGRICAKPHSAEATVKPATEIRKTPLMSKVPASQPVSGVIIAAATNRAAITISIMLATIMQAIDTTIANVALPHIQGSLSAAQDQIIWVLTSYIVAAAIMTPLPGWLAGAFGIKGVFLISVIGFTLTSALCGMAESLPPMVLLL